MAVVSSVPQVKQRADPIGYPDIGSSANMASKGEIVEEPVSCVIDDILYVAVGNNVKESKLTLLWAVEKSRGRRICILHVYVPAQTIPMMGAKFPVSSLKEQEVRAHRESERSYMQKILDEYLFVCRRMGVRAEELHIEAECIEKGILELISQHGIRRLVMGAAADKHHSKKMMDLKSKKAIYVRLQAPVFCHIQFICNGHLIYTREASLEAASSSQQANPNTETGHTNYLSQSFTLEKNNTARLPDPAQNLLSRVKCDNILVGGEIADSNGGLSTPQSRLYAEGSSDKWDGSSKRSISEASVFSSYSPSLMLDESVIPFGRTEGSKNGLQDGSMDDALYDQIEQAMAEGKNAKQEAFQEALRRRKAEKDALEAMQRAKASENSYTEELKQRKETEEVLAKEKEQLGEMKKELDEVIEELSIALDQKSLLERQIADSDQIVKELEQKIITAVELLQNYKNEKEGLQMECGIALKEAEELKKARGEGSCTQMPQFCSEFSFLEIEEATRNFDLSLKIGEGGYGSIYKATLRHTQVAIKMLHSNSLQGPSEFQQEVDVLGKLRHPNLVTLVGACPEAWILIYEYLPNGSLEDRLSCRDNTPPLSWQTRIRIATELCSVLIFLHSCKPHSIVHGDLKPANILLDSNFVSKLSDFGICRLLSSDGSSSNNTTECCRTDPKGTFVYMDPEFLTSGELTTKSDAYSFGIILLRLLTARPALGITREVQYALDRGNLKALLDSAAGDWPFVQAEQLANLALRCCEMNRKKRPDLALDVWRVLEPMRASCGSPSSFRLGSEDQFQPPPYFICPIFQEVMQDPHVAADGFTYEAEALRGWLDCGHDTSPMTNEKLAHRSQVPNLALRSAIQEWLQQN